MRLLVPAPQDYLPRHKVGYNGQRLSPIPHNQRCYRSNATATVEYSLCDLKLVLARGKSFDMVSVDVYNIEPRMQLSSLWASRSAAQYDVPIFMPFLRNEILHLVIWVGSLKGAAYTSGQHFPRS